MTTPETPERPKFPKPRPSCPIEIHGESKEEFKRRLKSEGKYDQFITVRERYKGAGVEAPEAWQKAARFFPPPGRPVEEQALPDGMPVSEAIAPAFTKVEEAKLVKEAKQDAERIEEEVEERSAETEARQWRRMADYAKGRKASELEQIRWVADNMHTPVLRIQRDAIPCSAAVNWLWWIRQSDANAQEFWKSSYPKLLPDKRTLEADATKNYDDGREVLEAIERVKAARDRSKEQT